MSSVISLFFIIFIVFHDKNKDYLVAYFCFDIAALILWGFLNSYEKNSVLKVISICNVLLLISLCIIIFML